MTPQTRPSLGVRIGSLALRNPVLVASGIIGYGAEYEALVDLGKIGGIVTKTVTRRARAGNPPPRVVEVPSGMLNSIGIENPGLEGFLETKVPILRRLPCAVIVSVEGEDTREFCELVDGVSRSGAAHAIEVNISCPNVGPHGMKYSTDAGLAREVMTAIRPLTRLPLIAKLTPNVTRIGARSPSVRRVRRRRGVAREHVRRHGRRLPHPPSDPRHGPGRPLGTRDKPLALAKTWEVAQAVDIPVIGMEASPGPRTRWSSCSPGPPPSRSEPRSSRTRVWRRTAWEESRST